MKPLPSLRAARKLTPKQLIREATGRAFGVEISLSNYRRDKRDKWHALRHELGDADWRHAIELQYGAFVPATGELHVLHDAGLFSCLVVTLWSLCDLLAEGQVVRKINFSRTLSAYKDSPDLDLYDVLFQSHVEKADLDRLSSIPRDRFVRFAPNGIYGNSDCALYRQMLTCFFKPGRQVQERIDSIRDHYLKPERRYVGVWFRGTDKSSEVRPTDSAFYYDAAQRLLTGGDAERVLIQTDQEQVCSVFKRAFGDSCDVIEALARTEGSVGIHKSEMEGTRLDHAITMLATVVLMSSMEHLVLYTGNIGAWATLERGHCRGVWQAIGGQIVPQWQVGT